MVLSHSHKGCRLATSPTHFFCSLLRVSFLQRLLKLFRLSEMEVVGGVDSWLRPLTVVVSPTQPGTVVWPAAVMVARPLAKLLISVIEFLNSFMSRFRAAAFISAEVADDVEALEEDADVDKDCEDLDRDDDEDDDM